MSRDAGASLSRLSHLVAQGLACRNRKNCHVKLLTVSIRFHSHVVALYLRKHMRLLTCTIALSLEARTTAHSDSVALLSIRNKARV